MENSFGVNVCNSVQNLFDYDFDLFFIDFVIFTSQKLLEVIVVEIEYYFEQLLLRFVYHLVERYNVGMFFEGLQQGNLSEGTGRDSLFLSFEFDVLDGHKFIIFIHCFVDLSEGSFPDGTNLSVPITFFHF